MEFMMKPSRPSGGSMISGRRTIGWIVSGLLMTGLLLLSGCASNPPRLPEGAEPFTDEQFQQRHAFMINTVVERPGMVRRFIEARKRQEIALRVEAWERIHRRQKAFVAREKVQLRGNVDRFNRLQEQLRLHKENKERERVEKQAQFLERVAEFNPPIAPSQLEQ